MNRSYLSYRSKSQQSKLNQSNYSNVSAAKKKTKDQNKKFIKNLLGNKKITLPKDPGDPELYYQILDDFEGQLQKEKKYLEAEYVRIIKQESKKNVEENMGQELVQLQIEEEKFIAKIVQKELKNFEKFWNKKILEFQEQCESLKQSLLEKQKQDFEEIKLELISNIPTQYKESKELVDMKQQEKFLSKNKNYIEAHYALEKVKQLEQVDQEKFKMDVQQQVFIKLEQLRHKQQKEFDILTEKIHQAKQEQKNAKQLDQQKLSKKFENMKNSLKSQHTNQQNKLEKTFITEKLNSSQLNESKFILNNQSSIISEKSRFKL